MVYLKLIRPLNLLMIFLTMTLFRYAIVDNPFYGLFDVKPNLDAVEFVLLVLTTVLVAAGGYVINDIFDSDIDRVNRPGKVLIENEIDTLKAYNFYKLLAILSVLTTIALAWMTQNVRLSTVPILILVALNFYAQYFKKQLLVGNLVVALCSAFVVFLPGLYESEKSKMPSLARNEIESGIFLAASFYAVFAFLTSFLREVIKDMEDVKGDDQYGCRTVPIVWGLKGARIVCLIPSLIILLIWTSVAAFFPAMYMQKVGGVVVILYVIPMLIFIFLLFRAANESHFRQLSKFIKGYMLLGILSMIYLYFITGPYLLFVHYANYLKKIF